MFDVDTLFVISSNRGEYVLDDMLASIAWSCHSGSFFTVVVDETSELSKLSAPGQYQLLHSDLSPAVHAGFHRAAGLKWAIDKGIAYRQVVMLADTALIISQDLDKFFTARTQHDGIGLIGVRSQRQLEIPWRETQAQLFGWKVPTAGWEHHPIGLCDDVLIMAGRFAGAMYERSLLVPSQCDTWKGTYGVFASWVCHMLGFSVVSWGFETKPLPPLYVSHAQGQHLPSPHILNPRFMLFSPVTKVMGYSEGDIRELYKQHRGEQSREVQKFQPIVTGPELRDVNVG